MQDDQGPRSVARSQDEAASNRFAGVKLELGIILLICIGVGAAVLKLDYPNWLELLVLGAVGFVCGGWLAIRTRNVVQAHDPQERSGHGPRQE